MSKTRDTINAGYAALCWITESSSRTSRLLTTMHRSALESERAHRRYAPSGYKESCETAARYFCCKWVASQQKKPASWTEAAEIRTDALCGNALRELLLANLLEPRRSGPRAKFWAAIVAAGNVDYVRQIARGE